MPQYTTNLKLFKYNTATDGKEVFSINEAMNYNWDILDKQPGTLKTNQITNCLTEVPQRINVGLNNGALTLKAGSVVIVPYGTSAPTFEVGDPLNGGEIVDISWDGQKLFYFVKYDEDLTSTFNIGDYDLIPQVNNDKLINTTVTDACYSGASEPTADFDDATWYDTTENVVKGTNDHGSTWITAYSSLPFCFAKATSAGYSSIETVFNGFGFIGSTIWCDKGVKGLASDGRNSDGSLKNIEIETEYFTTQTRDWFVSANQTQYVTITADGVGGFENKISSYYFEQKEKPEIQGHVLWHNTDENIMYWQNNDNIWVKNNCLKVFNINNTQTYTDGKIDNISEVKQVFRAVDYADTEFIAHQAMPSDRYIGLTLGATGSTYTAPANGWYCVIKDNGANGSYQFVDCHVMLPDYTPDGSVAPVSQYLYSVANSSTARNNGIHCLIPIRKGHLMQISYSATGDTQLFRFIYAQGAQGGS